MKKIILSIIVAVTIAGCQSEVRKESPVNRVVQPDTSKTSQTEARVACLQGGGTIRLCYDTTNISFRGDTTLVVELSSLNKVRQLLSDSAFKPVYDSIGAFCGEVDVAYAKKTDIIIWPFYLLSLLSVVLLVLLVIEIKKRKKMDAKLSEITRACNNNLELGEIKGDLSYLSNKYESLSGDLASLRELYNSLASSTVSVAKNKPEDVTTERVGKTDKIQELYAVSIFKDSMRSVTSTPDVASIFKMRLKNESEATVTIYEKSIDKVLANSSFLDGCDYTNLGGANPKSLTVEKEGVAVKRADNNWTLSVKPKIVLR